MCSRASILSATTLRSREAERSVVSITTSARSLSGSSSLRSAWIAGITPPLPFCASG